MKIVQINATCGSGSIGKICLDISKLLNRKGLENYILYSLGKSSYSNAIKYSNEFLRKIQSLFEKVTGLYGFGAYFTTKRMLHHLDQIKPDIVHIHNIHSHDCHLDLLFKYIRKNKIKVFWTFHDCWAFTAYCPYFDIVNCSKWKNGCNKCMLYKKYSFILDRSSQVYKLKKNALEGLDLKIITPSKWLANLVSQSYVKKYPVYIINNGINLDVFKPTNSDFKVRYNCIEKFVILGVSFIWDERKGIDVFIKLAEDLDDRFQIVLVGTNNIIDKILPRNIISIHKTQNQKELAEIYSAADLFLIPTREDNFPTVNIESIACGTPVMTFNTGGSPEIAGTNCGYVIFDNTYETLKEEVLNCIDRNKIDKEICRKRALDFDCNKKYEEYLNLYLDK